jgi:hypothetical protein
MLNTEDLKVNVHDQNFLAANKFHLVAFSRDGNKSKDKSLQYSIAFGTEIVNLII